MKNVLPPLTTEEFQNLKADLKAHGQSTPIFVDENGRVLDGVHRKKILKDKVKKKVLRGLSEAEKLAVTIRCNMSRRNLSPAQKTVLRDTQKNIAMQLRKEDAKKWTQQKLGAELGVSQQAVALWFGGVTNTSACNGYTPDARVLIPKKGKEDIIKRANNGETQTQLAADYGVSRQAVIKVISKDKDKTCVDKIREKLEAEGTVNRDELQKIVPNYTAYISDIRKAGDVVTFNKRTKNGKVIKEYTFEKGSTGESTANKKKNKKKKGEFEIILTSRFNLPNNQADAIERLQVLSDKMQVVIKRSKNMYACNYNSYIRCANEVAEIMKVFSAAK